MCGLCCACGQIVPPCLFKWLYMSYNFETILWNMKTFLPWLALESIFLLMFCCVMHYHACFSFSLTHRCIILMMRFKMTWLEWLKHYFLLYYFFRCTLHYKSSINFLFNQIDCISWSKFSKYGVHMHVKAWRCNSAKVSRFSYSILSTINLGSCLYDI